MRRILFAATATLLLAACESATAPTSPVRSPSAATREIDSDVASGTSCRSGWSVADGRCL
jgi:hypothetical protein